jgi:hypothetical protein
MNGRDVVFFVVEEVVVVVLRDREVDDLELADRAVATAWLDHDGTEGFDRDQLSIEFQMTFTFEDQIDLGGLLVVVSGRFVAHFEVVGGCRGIGLVDEGAASGPATAFDRREIGEVDVMVAFHGEMIRIEIGNPIIK